MNGFERGYRMNCNSMESLVAVSVAFLHYSPYGNSSSVGNQWNE